METKVSYYNNDGEEVNKDNATHMLVLTFDDDGEVIDSVFSYFENYKPKIINVQLRHNTISENID